MLSADGIAVVLLTGLQAELVNSSVNCMIRRRPGHGLHRRIILPGRRSAAASRPSPGLLRFVELRATA
jgi:hypothetical protein